MPPAATLSRTRPSSLALVGAILVAVGLAVFMGLLAGVGNMVMVVIAAGLVGGLFLIASPVALLWLGLVWTLVIAGSLRYFADFGRAEWLVFAAGGGFWLLAAMARFQEGRAAVRRGTPAFMVLTWLFFGLTLVNTLYQYAGIGQFAIGIKNYMMFFGLALLIAYGGYQAGQLRRLAFGLLAIGLLQLPVTVYQFVFVRGYRLATGGRGLYDSEVEASDSVVGTLGGNMYGGGLDDVLISLLCIVAAGLLAGWRYGAWSRRWLWLLPVILAPMLLTEAKIIFLYVPLVLLIVAWTYLKRHPAALLAMTLAIPPVIYGGLWAYYVIHWSNSNKTFEASVSDAFAYSFAEHAGKYRAQLGEMTRREAIEFWWHSHGQDQPDTLLFGHGLAASKSSSTVIHTDLVRQYGGLRLSKTGLSQLLWDTGLLGAGLYILALLVAALQAGRMAAESGRLAIDRAMLKATQVGLLIMVISLGYRNTAMQASGAIFLTFLMLGLVAYHMRYVSASRHVTLDSTNP